MPLHLARTSARPRACRRGKGKEEDPTSPARKKQAPGKAGAHGFAARTKCVLKPAALAGSSDESEEGAQKA